MGLRVQGKKLHYLTDPLDKAIVSRGVIGFIYPNEYYPFYEEHNNFYIQPYMMVMYTGIRNVVVGLNMSRETLELERNTNGCDPMPKILSRMQQGKCYFDTIDEFLKIPKPDLVAVEVEYQPHYEQCHYYELLRDVHRATIAATELYPIELLPALSTYVGLLAERYPIPTESWILAVVENVAYDPTLPVNLERYRLTDQIDDTSEKLLELLWSNGISATTTNFVEATFELKEGEEREKARMLLGKIDSLQKTLEEVDERVRNWLAVAPLFATEQVRAALRKEARYRIYDLSERTLREIYQSVHNKAEAI